MNERIETLAKVAGYDMINKAAMRALGFDVEKFAELIVKDCVAISKTWEDQLESAKKISESNAVGIVAYRISQHFGVEE